MKSWLLITALLLSFFTSQSQLSIQGRVSDRQQNLPSVTVLLFNQDSILVKGVVTSAKGEFVFEQVVSGKYRISASMIGYSRFISPQIAIEKENIIIPDIVLEETATQLGEVVIEAEKPLFEQQKDRLVVNVQSSITTSGNTILEVLQKSPGVAVNRQNNSLSMNGKSGVRIMMNGKLMQLPMDIVVQMLDGMNSSNVEKIELISAPPAKYDADGNAGLINIITKGNEGLGTNGSFGLTLGAHWAETFGGNFNINHRNKKIAYFIDYSILRNHNLHIANLERQSFDPSFNQVIKDYSYRENITTQQNLSAGIEWKVNNKTSLSLGFAGYRRNWDLTAFTNDQNYATIDSTVTTNMNIHELNLWQSATSAIELKTIFNSKSNISFNLDYLFYHNNNPSSYDSKLFYEQLQFSEASKINLEKETPIQSAIAKVDYQYNFSPTFSLEAGMKGVTSNFQNDVLVKKLLNTTWVTDAGFSSNSTMNEQIAAAYFSTQYKTKTQWSINTGLRYEYTHTSIETPTQSNVINRKYGYFFPNLLMEKTLGKERGMQLSYVRRITRPTYNDMAPFTFFWGPNTFSTGNTLLLPSVSDAIKIGYHLKQWIASLQWSHSEREIAFLQPEKDISNNLIFRSQNLDYVNTLSLTNSNSFSPTRWWEIQSTLTVQHQIATTSHLPNNVTLTLNGLNLNVINLFKLPKDFSIEVSGMYQSRSLTGISEYLPLGSLNAGIQKKIKNNGVLRLSMDDILYTNYWRIKTYSPQNNLDTFFDYNWHNQFVRLTFTRNFGSMKLTSLKLKSGSKEERERVSN